MVLRVRRLGEHEQGCASEGRKYADSHEGSLKRCLIRASEKADAVVAA